MGQFETLAEINRFIEMAQSMGMPIPENVLAEKARLEERERINEDEFIFSTMKAHNKFMSDEKEKCVREMVDKLLIDGPTATQPCLLLGNVQCGKTDTFENIMGLAMDRGIEVCVVFTKGTNTLTSQTIKRLTADFVYFKDTARYDQKVRVMIYDIMDVIKRGLSSNQINDPKTKFIIVCKKEAKNLEHLINLFTVKSPELSTQKVLIVDDEADFASRAYYQRKGEMNLLKIAEHIEAFTKIPTYCRFLQVTATPYSLYLQPDGTVQLRDGAEASPWLPRYTGLVPIHAKYVGGKQYYVESKDETSMYSQLFRPVSQICLDVLGTRNDSYLINRAHSENISDLTRAIVSYFMSAAIRTIQEKETNGKMYKTSCLIHVEINKKNHEWQSDLIRGIIEDVKTAFICNQNADLRILDLELEAYESLKLSNELGCESGMIDQRFPSFDEVQAGVRHILQFDDYSINVVNSEVPGQVETMLNDKGQLELTQTVNFFIGGSILDRGITIDNMLCFFYGRNPEKFQMDTVLQHARMYGARSKEDMACTRFFTTEKIYAVLEKMNAFDDYLRDYLVHHKDSVRTEDITSVVIGYDPKIKPTAQNKYKPANTKVLKPYQRILPYGFQTGTPAEISSKIKAIESFVEGLPGYIRDDYFLIGYDDAVKIVNEVMTTLHYSDALDNMDAYWNPNEMLTVLDHLTYNTDGQIYCVMRNPRNASRLRTGHGKYYDVPDDGRTDRPNELATDRPVLFLFRENGLLEQGWMGTPFVWPLLYTPGNTKAGIFTIDANKKTRVKTGKVIKLKKLETLPLEEVLSLTMTLGPAMDIILGLKEDETREIKKTTASLYLQRDEKGNYVFAEGVEPNKNYSVYTVLPADPNVLDGEKFPYALKDVKYLYLRCSRDEFGSKLLIELDPECPYHLDFSPYGMDDIVYGSDNSSEVVTDEMLAQWTVIYHVKKVLEYKFNEADKQTFEDYKNDLIEQGLIDE